jgi:hypothetical protein
MDEVENFGPLGCQGWVVIPQNVRKSQNHCTLVYITNNDHIMYNILLTGGAYYVPYSFLLISNKFCNGGRGPSRAIKFQYAPERPEQGD